MTNSSFSKRQLYEINTQSRTDHLAPAEQLEAACWNGLLDEMLPEITKPSTTKAKIFLWQIEMKRSFLSIFMGASPVYIIKEFSLDPYIFLCKQQMN